MARLNPEFTVTEEPQPVLAAMAGGPREAMASLIRRCSELNDSLKQTSRQEKRKRRRFYLALLQVADAFDRILRDTELAELDEIARNRMLSVSATSAMLQEVLAEEDIIAMDSSEGKPFDPAYEEAIGTEVRSDCPDRTVLEVKDKGYHWQEQVLRRARVVVSKHP